MCLHRTHARRCFMPLSWSPQYKRSLLRFVAVELILRADSSFLSASSLSLLFLTVKHAFTPGRVCHTNVKMKAIRFISFIYLIHNFFLRFFLNLIINKLYVRSKISLLRLHLFLSLTITVCLIITRVELYAKLKWNVVRLLRFFRVFASGFSN